MSEASFGAFSRDQIRVLQLERLQEVLNRAYFHVDFYRRRMDELGVLPENVGSFEELRHFPFTTSKDLARHYPYGIFAAPLRSIVRLKITTNSEGQPVVVGFTRRDVHLWQDLMVRLYEQVGVTDRDIVQVAYNFSLFPGAFTFNQAAEIIGATMAPVATVSATLQLKIMRDFRSTVLATTPALALQIADTMERLQCNASDLHLRMVLLGPEPISDAARQRLELAFKAPVYVLYGVREMVEPGLAGECAVKNGYHLAEDHFLPEIVHPLTGETVSPGQEGELVLTTLTSEAYPLIRYRTGDITVLHETPCPCGSRAARIVPILRRTDSRVSVRGIPFYPEQVGYLLRELDPDMSDFRLIIHTRYNMGEQLEILLTRPVSSSFSGNSRSQYLDIMRSHIRRVLGLSVRIQLVDADRLPKEGLINKTVFRSLLSPFEPQ